MTKVNHDVREYPFFPVSRIYKDKEGETRQETAILVNCTDRPIMIFKPEDCIMINNDRVFLKFPDTKPILRLKVYRTLNAELKSNEVHNTLILDSKIQLQLPIYHFGVEDMDSLPDLPNINDNEEDVSHYYIVSLKYALARKFFGYSVRNFLTTAHPVYTHQYDSTPIGYLGFTLLSQILD
jgi:hypothetical protein